MSIDQLLDRVKSSIDDENLRTNSVGNRPHYPVFVAFSGAQLPECAAFTNNISRIWSRQICRNLLFYRYEPSDGGVRFTSAESDEAVDHDKVYRRISEASRTRDIFSGLDTWCLYNIIDTSNFSFEQFEASYRSLGALRYVVDENVRSMVLVILRESREHERKVINYRVREFLMNAKDYDGVMLVSNRSRGGTEFTPEDIYKIASNAVLLSDNDAVSAIDDKCYLERNIKLYSGKPIIMSYNSLSKPTKEILHCMTESFVKAVRESITGADNRRMYANDIDAVIGISNGRLMHFEGFINSVRNELAGSIPPDFFLYLPMMSPTVLTDADLSTKRFAEVKHLFNIDSLVLTARSYCRRLVSGDESKRLFESYRESINENLNLLNINNISEEGIANAFNAIMDNNRVNEGMPIRDYYINLIICMIKNEFIYPFCRDTFKSICDADNIRNAGRSIEEFERRLEDEAPLSGFDEIAQLYGGYMKEFTGTDEGKKRIREFAAIGNTYDDLMRIVEETLHDANEFCNGNINMPYIQLWANALKLKHPAAIFHQIKHILDGEGDNAILLRGSFPVIRELAVYSLHCYDRNGENNTWLYDQFREAFSSLNDVHFFNSGSEDTIESIKFYKCEGTNLILGLDPID